VFKPRRSLVGHEGRHFKYQARLCPWPWFLTRTSDCRIFQDQGVPEIVKTVFQDHAVADFEFHLSRPYRSRTYCVQYRETDLEFVARLLADEGIYWHVRPHPESRWTRNDFPATLPTCTSRSGSSATRFLSASHKPFAMARL
jgi:uncharacterized protein involved in type VI secretion and phage assembly